MTKETVDVVIDSGESRADDLISAIALHPEVEDWKMRSLTEGDIKIGDVRFERKTPQDFAASVMDTDERNIKDQLTRMVDEAEFACLLIEGSASDFDNLDYTEVDSSSLRGMVARITRSYCPVLFCENATILVDMAVRIGRKDIEPESDFIKMGGVTGSDVPYKTRAFAAVDGIGLEMAEVLSERFESIAEACEATVDDLKEVEGIGETRATTIVTSLQGYD